jgi:glycosyltransferase involved in cell wall biosynthesis
MSKKVLFVHEGKLGSYNKGIYGIHYKNELVERYSFFGKKVSFLMREIPLGPQDLDKYSKIDHPDFNFIPIPNFKSLKSLHNKNKARIIIHKAVETHDVIIVRLPSAAGVIAFKEAKKLHKPVLIEFVACVFDALWNYDWRGKILANYKYSQYQKIMKKATHGIYVTNTFLQSRYPSDNGKSIGCSDVELQIVDDEILNARLNKIQETKTPLRLATVAAIDVIYKGQADVIEAIGVLKSKNVSFKYEIIGQGNPYRLQTLIDKLIEVSI